MARRRRAGKKIVHNLLTSPGTLQYLGPEVSEQSEIFKVTYNASLIDIKKIDDLKDLRHSHSKDINTWIHVNGIHNRDLIAQIGELYQLHPLILENVMNAYRKPKLDSFKDDQLFLTIKSVRPAKEVEDLEIRQLSFVLAPNLLISFQQYDKDIVFEPILNRLKASVGKTRTMGTDYLLYALSDMVIDQYFIAIDYLDERLSTLEETVIEGKSTHILHSLYDLKRDMASARRVIAPVREILNQMIRDEIPQVRNEILPYLRDSYDHIIQILEMLDTARDVIASLVDIHLSTLSNRMNQVMKTLTIFSAIFLPITFIVGVYGMNFPNIPEFAFPNAYFWLWGIMIAITISLIAFFKWKRWM